jgi:hypothetical protein
MTPGDFFRKHYHFLSLISSSWFALSPALKSTELESDIFEILGANCYPLRELLAKGFNRETQ